MNAPVATASQAPVKATWVVLLLAWLMFLLPLPGTGVLVGWPLNLVAFILAIVVMARGRTAGGIVLLLLTLVASPLIYFVLMPLLYLAGGVAAAGVELPAGLSL